MQGVTESMAGRAAILQLLPFSLAETDGVSLLHGGYPEVLARPAGRGLWFSSYIQTYLERDVRAIVNVRDLATFRRFLALLASRHGQILNKDRSGRSARRLRSDGWRLASCSGDHRPGHPGSALFRELREAPDQVTQGVPRGLGIGVLPPGIATQAELDRSPFLGALFEGHVAAEILKSQINRGRRKELYHFRDQQGLEVDFLFPNDRMVVDGNAKRRKPSSHTWRSVGVLAPIHGRRGARRSSVVHRASTTARRCGAGAWHRGARCAGIRGRVERQVRTIVQSRSGPAAQTE